MANQLFGLDFVSKRVQYEANFTTASDLTGFKQFCVTKALQEGNEEQIEIAVLQLCKRNSKRRQHLKMAKTSTNAVEIIKCGTGYIHYAFEKNVK